ERGLAWRKSRNLGGNDPAVPVRPSGLACRHLAGTEALRKSQRNEVSQDRAVVVVAVWRSTDRLGLGGGEAKGGYNEMDHTRVRQGRSRRLPLADQKICRQGRGIHFRADRQGDGGSKAPRCNSLRRQKCRTRPPRQRVFVRGYRQKI